LGEEPKKLTIIIIAHRPFASLTRAAENAEVFFFLLSGVSAECKKKSKLCVLCASSETGGELLPIISGAKL